MKATSYKCDVCGAPRKEANHWFLATPVLKDALMRLEFAKWSDELAGAETSRHLCGEQCALQLLHKFLNQ